MSEIMDEVRAEGREEMRQECVVRMINSGKIPIEEIAQYAGITTEEVKKIMEREKGGIS